jgi:hypothetical protein
MPRFPRILATLLTLAVVAIALVGSAGHKPVCCKGYTYWDILEPHGDGHQWRKVKDPVTMREVPITPSIWELSEAKSRSALFMMSKAQRSARNLQIKARDWDAVCWHYGDAEPSRLSWPVQP